MQLSDKVTLVFADKDTYLRVPIEGPHGRGGLFIHVQCDPSCILQRAEVEVHETTTLDPEAYEGKRLLIYDFKKHGPRKLKNE